MYQCVVYDGHSPWACYYLLDMDPDFYGETYEEIVGNPDFHQRVDECLGAIYNGIGGENWGMVKKDVFLISNDSFKKIIV